MSTATKVKGHEQAGKPDQDRHPRRERLYGRRAGAPTGQPSAGGDHHAHGRPPRGQASGRRFPAPGRARPPGPDPRRGRGLGGARRGLLLPAPRHHPGGHRRPARTSQGGRPLGRFQAPRRGHLCRVVRARAPRARAPGRGRLRLDGAQPRSRQGRAPHRQPGLLPFDRAAAPRPPRQGGADRGGRHHHRRQVGHHGCGARTQGSQPLRRGERGHSRLRHRRAPPRARDRAGAEPGRRGAHHGQLHGPTSCP